MEILVTTIPQMPGVAGLIVSYGYDRVVLRDHQKRFVKRFGSTLPVLNRESGYHITRCKWGTRRESQLSSPTNGTFGAISSCLMDRYSLSPFFESSFRARAESLSMVRFKERKRWAVAGCDHRSKLRGFD